MYAVPSVEEVITIAESLGIHLAADEAALYRKGSEDPLNAYQHSVDWEGVIGIGTRQPERVLA